jgi:NAD(P)-dependent dehydrogenase (short-subunit alcohol dehydrogenase family)
MSLQDTRVVILGGTSGLGFATAEAAAHEGARIAIASSSQERVNRAVAALPAGTEGFVVDVSREDDIARLFGTVGAFDHLMFTAGGCPNGSGGHDALGWSRALRIRRRVSPHRRHGRADRR